MKAALPASLLLAPLLLGWGCAALFELPLELCFAASIFISAVFLWMTELIPLPVTSLLIPVLISLSGLASPTDAFAPFANPVIYLFLGAFLLAIAMQKHGLDNRLALWLLKLPRKIYSLRLLVVSFAVLSFILSMWISNTATVAMLAPMALGVRKVLQDELDDTNEVNTISCLLLLTIAYAASIGGVATPVGTPPNVLLLGFLESRGLEVSFSDWMLFALPLAATMLIAALVALDKLHPLKRLNPETLQRLSRHFKERYLQLGPIRSAEKSIATYFSLAVFLWLAPDLLGTLWPDSLLAEITKEYLHISIVAIGVSLLLFITNDQAGSAILTWQDTRSIDWGTLILFGGGLSLGSMLADSGLASLIASSIFDLLGNASFLLLIGSSMLAILLTECASNTATASVFLPLLLALFPGELQSLEQIAPVVAVCLATSFSFMLPVATPPNAIVFGTGHVPLRAMIRAGIALNVLGLLLIVVFSRLFL